MMTGTLDPWQGFDGSMNLKPALVAFDLDFTEKTFTFARGLMPGELAMVAEGKMPVPRELRLSFTNDVSGEVETLVIEHDEDYAEITGMTLDFTETFNPPMIEDLEAQSGKLHSRRVIMVEAFITYNRLSAFEGQSISKE
jgi:hypothetical protein